MTAASSPRQFSIGPSSKLVVVRTLTRLRLSIALEFSRVFLRYSCFFVRSDRGSIATFFYRSVLQILPLSSRHTDWCELSNYQQDCDPDCYCCVVRTLLLRCKILVVISDHHRSLRKDIEMTKRLCLCAESSSGASGLEWSHTVWSGSGYLFVSIVCCLCAKITSRIGRSAEPSMNMNTCYYLSIRSQSVEKPKPSIQTAVKNSQRNRQTITVQCVTYIRGIGLIYAVGVKRPTSIFSW